MAHFGEEVPFSFFGDRFFEIFPTDPPGLLQVEELESLDYCPVRARGKVRRGIRVRARVGTAYSQILD